MEELRAVAPCFAVEDVAATTAWYEANLGFRSDAFPEQPPFSFAVLYRDDVRIMLQAAKKPRPPSGWAAHITVRGIHDLHASLRERGAATGALVRRPHGDWEFELTDPNGYLLVFSELAEVA